MESGKTEFSHSLDPKRTFPSLGSRCGDAPTFVPAMGARLMIGSTLASSADDRSVEAITTFFVKGSTAKLGARRGLEQLAAAAFLTWCGRVFFGREDVEESEVELFALGAFVHVAKHFRKQRRRVFARRLKFDVAWQLIEIVGARHLFAGLGGEHAVDEAPKVLPLHGDAFH